MTTTEATPMVDLTNQSLSQRCSFIVNRIKTRKESCSQFIFPLNDEITQNEISPTKQCAFTELDSIRTSRIQSFSHWPHLIPNRDAMSLNGWYYCNTGDRVLCIYCNTLCHNWTNTDDPYEVHLRLAPECSFILSISSSKESFSMINDTFKGKFEPRHPTMCQIICRQETFNNSSWKETSPSIDNFTYAGFYYAGTGNTVICFCCGGSLHQWSANDDPKIEHARWFPDCIYAKHLCGDRLHAKIQLTKKKLSNKKPIFDNETLNRLVNARLDLPIVQRLRNQYKLSIIKRCFEDQLKLNHDDFSSENDLLMACFILQKQIEIIQGNPDNIITPSQNQSLVNLSDMSNIKEEDCVICLTEKKQLACIPCGHLCACVPCGYSLQSCPICRKKIQSFMRIYSSF